tara:strand:- start:134 stop:256 length:123 start_codon:yes stop_codon:yes gene_type:complete
VGFKGRLNKIGDLEKFDWKNFLFESKILKFFLDRPAAVGG